MRLRLFGTAVMGLILFAGGCRSLDSRPNAGPCPAAASLYEAQRVVKLDGTGELFSDITYTGEINAVRLFCRYADDDPIIAEVEIDFAYGKGPAATGNSETYEFFVAVTRTNRAVIEKQVFPVEVRFPPGQTVVGKRELIGRIQIPRADNTVSGANFEVLVGFELTPEQLAFNTSGKRFLLGAGSQ